MCILVTDDLLRVTYLEIRQLDNQDLVHHLQRFVLRSLVEGARLTEQLLEQDLLIQEQIAERQEAVM